MAESSGSSVRGVALAEALKKSSDAEARDALATEAGRIVDRLDELDRIIAGKGVLELMRFRLHESWGEDNDRTVLVEVKFDNVLGEARQQANALRQILVSLGLGRSGESAPVESKGSPLDELARRRKARESGSSGRART